MLLATLIVGLAALWLGTEATIRGAVAIADRLRISEFIVGLAIVSVGSDLPELAIAIDAALMNLQGAQVSDLVVGSALGSCLAQIGFVLGVAGLIANLSLPTRSVYRHGGMLLGSLIVLGVFALDGHISRLEGVALVTFYFLYFALILSVSETEPSAPADKPKPKLALSLLSLVVGLIVVIVSAEVTVSSATQLAESLNIEQSIIAIFIVGIGSSLPELSISLAAVAKKKSGLSIGNLIGSNIFDTLVPVGVAAIIADLAFSPDLLRNELVVLFAISAVVLILFRKPDGIRRLQASFVLFLYAAYAIKTLSVL